MLFTQEERHFEVSSVSSMLIIKIYMLVLVLLGDMIMINTYIWRLMSLCQEKNP